MYSLKIVFCFIATIITLRYNLALIGFDCGGRHLNITVVSLLDVGECDIDYQPPNTTQIPLQLLQLSDYTSTEVIQCKVEISRTAYYCGMHSHISLVSNGKAEYLHDTKYDACLRMFQYGSFQLDVGPRDYPLKGIKANQTTSFSYTMAGEIYDNGACEGVKFEDPYGRWDNVVIQATIKITLKSYYAPIRLNAGKIILKSGTVCSLTDGACLDPDDGYTFWRPMPADSCKFGQYDVLFQGPAVKITTNDDNSPVVYSLTTQDVTFALTATKAFSLCGYNLLRTEHPKLFILEVKNGDTFKKPSPISVDNLDIFTYMNSKFVYVEKHVRSQMSSLYRNVMQQKCELERQVLTNALSFATLQPDEFAYRLMKQPGYMAVTTGEAVHVIKCIPVETAIRKTEGCYTELPVTVRNASLFLTPKSRILTKFGNARECNNELPTLHHVEDTWIQFTPKPQAIQLPPQQLKPMTQLSWKYSTPGALAISGIYSENDIQKLRDHIMFPAEKPALLNDVVRQITGHQVHPGGASMYNLLDEASLNKIVESTTTKVWQGFVSFGSATAGIMGIFIIIRVIKIVIDTAIHGYALHTVYGCGLHLLGAIWSSLTHLLLHLARPPPRKRSRDDDQNQHQELFPIQKSIGTHQATPVASSNIILNAPTSLTTNPSTTTTPMTTETLIASPYYTLANDRTGDREQTPQRVSGFVLK